MIHHSLRHELLQKCFFVDFKKIVIFTFRSSLPPAQPSQPRPLGPDPLAQAPWPRPPIPGPPAQASRPRHLAQAPRPRPPGLGPTGPNLVKAGRTDGRTDGRTYGRTDGRTKYPLHSVRPYVRPSSLD